MQQLRAHTYAMTIIVVCDQSQRKYDKSAENEEWLFAMEMQWIIIKTYFLSIFKDLRRSILPVNMWLCKLLSVIALILTCFTHDNRPIVCVSVLAFVCAPKLRSAALCFRLSRRSTHYYRCSISVTSIGGTNHRLYRLWTSKMHEIHHCINMQNGHWCCDHDEITLILFISTVNRLRIYKFWKFVFCVHFPKFRLWTLE